MWKTYKVTVDEWRHIPSGHSVSDGYNGHKTAPTDPVGLYTLYQIVYEDNNTHAGWEWVLEDQNHVLPSVIDE